ncbi:MAG TPA: site-specific integrase [Polyangiaceae bacterium]|nr:site-specific integrase [Polyangiaceae bacterium]
MSSSLWLSIEPRSAETRLLLSVAGSGPSLKARLPTRPRHPHALVRLMEALSVAQSVWQGETIAPKSNKPRKVPLTQALHDALKAHRHLKGERVLYGDDGQPPGVKTIQSWMASAQRRAALAKTSAGVHLLRHTYCSHLAMRGAPARAIQELAGHADLSTTLRYMHLTPGASASAIALLNARPLGETVEKTSSAS